jgi:hypothetical protein
MIDFSSFSDELEKIAKARAIYDPGVVAHEAGHAQVHKNRAWSLTRRSAPVAASLYRNARIAQNVVGGAGMGLGESAAVSAFGSGPVIADEAAASVIGMKKIKKKMTKADWKKAALHLAAVNSSYLADPIVDIATVGAAKAGLHPLVQLGMQIALKPLAGGAWSSLAMRTKGPKITATEAKKIVGAVAPKGTPTFAINEPIPGGARYIPPSKTLQEQELVSTQYGGVLAKRDLKDLQRKGGVLIAPLDPETQMKSSIPFAPSVQVKTKFRRLK